MDAGLWSWLEVAKLIAGLLTPAIVGAVGIYIHRITKRFEYTQWRSQKLIEKRLHIYDDLAPALNDLLCYFSFVGCWRSLDPPKVVDLKRAIDKKIYLAAPLFSKDFFPVCMQFQTLCFQTYNGWGKDARLRTPFRRRKEARQDWDEDWNMCFSDEHANPNEIRMVYNQIMTVFSRDIGVGEDSMVPPPGSAPHHYK